MSEYYFSEGVELLEYGPVPGVLLAGSLFIEPFMRDYGPPYEGRTPRTLIFFKEGKLLWLTDFTLLEDEGNRLFVKYILQDSFREGFNVQWGQGKNAMDTVMNEIENTDLRTLSNEDLIFLAERFQRSTDEMESPTVVPEWANYGAERYLKKQLSDFIPTEEISETMNILTAPEEPSFSQQEEIELLSSSDIKGHQKKYFWLQNGFGIAHVLPIEFFEKRKKEIDQNKEVEVMQFLKNAKDQKERVRKKYNLSGIVMHAAREIWQTILMQDERKKYNYMGGHYADVLMREVARRFHYDPIELFDAKFEEVIDIVRGQDIHGIIQKRRDGVALAITSSKVYEIDGGEMIRNWEKYSMKEELHYQREVTGVVACRGGGGKIIGRIKIIEDPKRASDLKEGEILVAVMTSPDYVIAMRNAKAIITNFGGLTSHAAIVSRELGKPCIIGTKNATQVLRDGDEVELDIDRGTARILSR
ncbi:MAG: PEP-utilizing enzyme [Candidatus Andersenbacteria bacterium]